MSEGPRHKVAALPDGTFRVVTTLERVLTREEMVKLAIPLPPAELLLPWQEEKAGPPPERLRQRPEVPASASPVAAALNFWTNNVGHYDARLPQLFLQAIREFGLDRLIGAMGEIQAQASDGTPKYVRLKKVLNRMRRGDR